MKNFIFTFELLDTVSVINDISELLREVNLLQQKILYVWTGVGFFGYM